MIEIKTIPSESDHATYPTPLSEDQRSRFNRVIGRPTVRHIIFYSWSSIVIDRMLLIAPRQLRANNKWKNQFKLENLIFHSKKSLKFIQNSEKFRNF